MRNLLNKYESKFSTSKVLFERSKGYFPNGVCHDIRSYPPFPVVTDRCDDIYMYDKDGNKILDLWMGHYALLLGHGSFAQCKGVTRAMQTGIHHGTINSTQLEFAELIQNAIPEMEQMRFCSSGTEATMYVTRIARAFTKRDIIVKVEGGWHGGNSVLSNGVIPPFVKRKNAPEGQKTVSVPYNNPERTLEILNEYKGEVAGIILEPMLGAGGGLLASEEFLKTLRTYCDENDTLLIYDEVITGFRFRYGSIAPIVGVTPDLFTFGKAAAGGMHIGIYGGRADAMSTITKQKLFTGGGTYSANPMSMSVGIETLKYLQTMDYAKLNTAGGELRDFLASKITKLKIPVAVTGFGSYFCLHLLTEELNVPSPHELMTMNDKQAEENFKIAMLLNNVFTMHSGGALSFKHLENVTIETIKRAYLDSFEMLEII